MGGKKKKVKREHNILPSPFCFVPFHPFPFTTQRALWVILITHYPGWLFLTVRLSTETCPCGWKSLCQQVSPGEQSFQTDLWGGEAACAYLQRKTGITFTRLQRRWSTRCSSNAVLWGKANKETLEFFRSGGPATPSPAEMVEGGFFLRGDYRVVTNSSKWRCRKKNNTLSLFRQRS